MDHEIVEELHVRLSEQECAHLDPLFTKVLEDAMYTGMSDITRTTLTELRNLMREAVY